MAPELSKQLNRILHEASLFRHLFDAKKQRMQTIENKLRNIANQTNQMHANTNIVRRAGIVGVIMGVFLGVAGFIAGVVIVPSVVVGVVGLSAGVSTAGFGAAAVVSSFITKIIMESWTIKATQTMAAEFLSLLNIFPEHLQQIKNFSETLMRNYSSHETVRERLGITTRETVIFNRVIEEIVQHTTDVMAVGEVFDDVMPRLNNIRIMPFDVINGTPQRDKDLTDIIKACSERCNKTIENFQKIDSVLSALIGLAEPPQNNDIYLCLLFILMFYFLFNLYVSIMFLHSLQTR